MGSRETDIRSSAWGHQGMSRHTGRGTALRAGVANNCLFCKVSKLQCARDMVGGNSYLEWDDGLSRAEVFVLVRCPKLVCNSDPNLRRPGYQARLPSGGSRGYMLPSREQREPEEGDPSYLYSSAVHVPQPRAIRSPYLRLGTAIKTPPPLLGNASVLGQAIR